MTKWSIKQIYREAWQITTHHKRLWILGLAVTFLAGGGNFNTSRTWSDSQSNRDQQVEAAVPTPLLYPSVSDTSELDISNLDQPDLDLQNTQLPTAIPFNANSPVWQTLFQIPQAFLELGGTWWGLLAAEILFFVAYIIIFTFIAGNWARAALTLAIDQAVTKPNQDLPLTKPSLQALTRIKALIWLQIVPVLKFTLVALLAIIVGVIVFLAVRAVSQTLDSIILLLGIGGGFIAALYYGLTLSVSLLWAERQCVLENTSGSAAFTHWWQHVKGTRRKAIRLGFTNLVLMIGVQLVGVVIAAPFVFQGLKQLESSTPFNLSLVITIGAGATALMAYYFVASAILQTFTYTTWYFAYSFITKKNHDAKT